MARRLDNHHNERGKQEQIQIVDPVLRHGFAQLPRLVLRAKGLSDKAKVVYALLLDYAWQQGSCFPGQHRLAQDLSTTERTIRRALDELRRFRLIDWKRRGLSQTNIYYILSLASHPGLVESKPERTKTSDPERTPLSDQKRTRMTDEEDTEEPDEDLHLRNSKGNASRRRAEGTRVLPDQPSTPDQSVTDSITPYRSGTEQRRRSRGFRPVAESLQRAPGELAHALAPSIIASRQRMSEQLTACVTEITQDFGDARHLRSNLTRALHLQERLHLPDAAFVTRLFEARAITRDRQMSRGGGGSRPVLKPMAYFWQVVEDILAVDRSEATITPDRVDALAADGKKARGSDGQVTG